VLDGEEMIQADAARRLDIHSSQILQWRRRPDLMPATLSNRLQLQSRTA
jgi:transposase-like protein